MWKYIPEGVKHDRFTNYFLLGVPILSDANDKIPTKITLYCTMHCLQWEIEEHDTGLLYNNYLLTMHEVKP